ncbi:hypothetical protein J1614_002832 [Plenodomus biglobosus]|nr:hypothetical protein J1614_002832 [Plenodomus biglobosus]
MVVARNLIALAISCLPLQIAAHQTFHTLSLQHDEPQADLLDRALTALGLQNNTSIQTIRIGGSQFRTRAVVMTMNLKSMDYVIVPYGSQTITYDYTGDALMQRVDKVSGLGSLMYFARPNLEPMNYTLVVKAGTDGFAAVTEGSFSVFAPGAPPEGLLDGFMASIMITDSHKWNPLLLQQIRANNNFTMRYERIEHDLRLPAVYDHTTGLSVLIDPDTSLPFAIRSYEDHAFFGPSTNDLRVYDYSSFDGVMIPRKFKVIYNNERFITDFLSDDIAVNAEVPATFFDAPTNITERNVPVEDKSATAQIVEQRATYTYFGRSNPTVADLEVEQPYPDMPGVWLVKLPEVFRYRQILLEMDDYVIAMDAPLDQSALVLEWSMQTLGKPIKQVWPTHHHHDHAYGVKTFVEAGVEVVVPEIAVEYYSKVPGIKFATFNQKQPYVAETKNFRATYIHLEGTIHAEDHAIGVIMPPCPTNTSSVVIFDADHVVNIDMFPTFNDHSEVDQLVMALGKFRVAKSAAIVPVHGSLTNLTTVLDGMGYKYPEYTPLDFTYGSESCVA